MERALKSGMGKRVPSRALFWLVVFLFSVGTLPGSSWAASKSRRARPLPNRVTSRLPCGNLLGFQVLLDRQGFSPGEIDARAGANLHRALVAFQTTRALAATGEPDCATWQALQNDAGESAAALVSYEVTADDVRGPFTEQIPPRLDEQTELPALEYRSPLERLAERFHAAPSLLRSINRTARFEAGERIQVPAVTPFDPVAKPPASSDGELTVTVSREDSSLRVTRGDSRVVFFAPVSSGTAHDPLPPGDWKITSVAWRPVFHYNPDLFWDANESSKAAPIKAGPNNPVGVVWIGINLDHYGLHGTPEPSRIGAAQSHGCVRLTNWDAARLASLVKPGTAVLFR
jgi:lipoprotein-anchoring transpeptidase ErfK/SrfK